MATAAPALTCPRCQAARARGLSCQACGLLTAQDGSAWELAGLGRRLAGGALFAGTMALSVVPFFLAVIAVLSTLQHSEDYPSGFQEALMWSALLAIPILYGLGWLALAGQGQSPIKRWLGMRVITANGRAARRVRLFVRAALGMWLLGGIVPYIVQRLGLWPLAAIGPLYLLADLLALLIDTDRRALHDRLAGTYAVRAASVAPGKRENTVNLPAPAPQP